jgi:hypothetical protein
MFDIDFLGNAVEERRNLVPNTAAAVGNGLDVRNLRGLQLRGHAGQGLRFRRGIRDVRPDLTRWRDPNYPQVKANPILHEDIVSLFQLKNEPGGSLRIWLRKAPFLILY